MGAIRISPIIKEKLFELRSEESDSGISTDSVQVSNAKEVQA